MVDTVKVLNPLQALQNFGQSVWFDYVRRNLLTSGELTRLINEDGLKGMTSNPAIFEKAIGGSTDYDQALQILVKKHSESVILYEELAIEDIQNAADLFKPVFVDTKGRDGYVSLEVSPTLANDTKATIEEARRLWSRVNRPNVMIKVPGTEAGIPAVEKLISEGININVTLLFSQETYSRVAHAFIKGLKTYATNGGDIGKVASVASFFVSRIDTLVDNAITEKLKSATASDATLLQSLLGKVAIANAKLAYQSYKEIFSSSEWHELAKKGAQTQRLLWASTGTKNAKYSDVLYVEQLIGQDTVNTMPPATFDAFKDHGKLAATLESDIDEARRVMADLAKLGISMEAVCAQLVEEGVKLFADAFEKLLAALSKKCCSLKTAHLDSISYHLDGKLTDGVHAAVKNWQNADKTKRLWAADATLWTNQDEAKWLGWLGITYDQIAHITPLKTLSDDVKKSGFKHALLLGMGGSSLGPEVFKKTFGHIDGYPELYVLDSTDPAQISTFEKKIELEKTIFIVSSKSGTTTEPNILKQYFFDKVKTKLGKEEAGKRFIAVTDPGSKLDDIARTDDFRYIFHGLPSIGGRYSVLSNFGLVPAAVMGIDIALLLERAEFMVHSCAAQVPAENNPGVLLGSILGVLAQSGRDKVTIVASPGISDFGAWLEQLIAESTGKSGLGLVPIDGEKLEQPSLYGNDRLFVYIRLASGVDSKQDKAIDVLQDSGQPIVRLTIEDIYDIGQEFFRWELAVAVAGSIIGINPFNQPDVEASKVATRDLTSAYEKTGKLPEEAPFFEADGIKLFSDKVNTDELKASVGGNPSLTAYLKAHLERIKVGDYFAFLAYLEMNEEHREILQYLRHKILDSKKVATCLEFGPRFLHSTGQAYKGGPDTGVFLQITSDDTNDLDVPGQKYTFGVVKAAQARGDFQVLTERKRRALRVHLAGNLKEALAKLKTAIEAALIK
jgi:transaldolase/glucose-6-phosphate isomerase